MFFSRKPTRFILVERDKLLLYPHKGAGPLAFSEDTVRFLEVKNEAKLAAAVQDYAAKNDLGGQRLLIMLDKSIVFQKAVPVVQGLDSSIAKADFESKVPFAPSDRQVISIPHKEHHFMFGVNRAFYRVLVDAFTKAGVKVMAVAPAIVYGITDTEKINPAKLKQIADATSLTHSTDFMGSA